MVPAPANSFAIPSDCDPASVDGLVQVLGHQVAAASPGAPLSLDFTPGRPTAVALQLAVSAALSLRRKGAFGGYGATAAPLLASVAES